MTTRAHIPLTDIVVSETRQRRTFDEKSLKDLVESIAEKGLFHAPVGILVDADKRLYNLVAGERRLRAIKTLHDSGRLFSYNGEIVKPGETPIVVVTDLDEIQIEEAELEENLLRVDLTWQERTAAYDRLHRMRMKANPAQTLRATAEEVVARTNTASTPKQVAQEISRAGIVAQHLDNPKVQKARSAAEAYSIISRDLQGQFQAELARRHKNKPTLHTCIHGDFTTLAWSDLGKFDVIVADPPYGLDTQDFGDAALLRHEYDDTPEQGLETSKRVIDLACSVLNKSGIAYIFCDVDNFTTLRDYAESKELNPLRTPLVWNKGGGMGHIIGDGNAGIRRSYELILMIFADKKSVIETMSDVLTIPPVKDKVHAAQKPVELYSRLMQISALPGGRVLDPCCGSGTVFSAAVQAHLYATGIELNAEFYRTALIAQTAAEGDEK